MQFRPIIFITGVERSGSTLVTRVLQMCGASVGKVNKMRENEELRSLNHSFINLNVVGCGMPDLDNATLPVNWKNKIETRLKQQNITDNIPFVYKDSGLAQAWYLWHLAYPSAKWIIVRRKTEQIVHSCMETAYMDKFKNVQAQEMIGAKNEREGWLWWIYQYEQRFREMAEKVEKRTVWPERMGEADFSQMQEVVEWCGLEWNPDVEVTMQYLLNKKTWQE